MATIYYPAGTLIYQRNTTTGSLVELSIDVPPATIFFFTGSGNQLTSSIASASYSISASRSDSSSFALTSSFPWQSTGSAITYLRGNVGVGTANPLQRLHIEASSSLTEREGLLLGTVNDAPIDKFLISNGTIVDNRFVPVFGGLVNSTNKLWSLGFAGMVSASNDASSSSDYGLVDFSAFRTTDVVDPLNGTLSSIVNRKLFSFRGLDSTMMYMVIDAGGKVGMGTAFPRYELEIQKTASLNSNINISCLGLGDVFPGLRLTRASGSTKVNREWVVNVGTTGNLNFFDSTGNNSVFYIQPNCNANTLVLSSSRCGIGTGNPNYQLEITTDSAGKPGVGGLWTVVSDERIKRDILPADLDRCYEIVKDTPLKYFGWQDGTYTEEQARDRHNLGWMAQDVQKMFPKAVSTVRFTGSGDFRIDDCLNLNGAQMYMAMYGALQKAIQKIELLETKVESLKTK